MSQVLSRLIDKPISPHQVSTEWRAYCTSPDTVFGNLSAAERQMSFGLTLSIYTTPVEPRYQMINNEALQEWRQHALVWASPGHGNPPEKKSWRIARPSRLALIHRTVVWPTPCLIRASHMESKVVLKAASVCRKTPRALSRWSKAFSTRNTSWWRAVSTDFPAWQACWLGCSGTIATAPSLKYLSTSLSMVLSRNDVRMWGLKFLGPV